MKQFSIISILLFVSSISYSQTCNLSVSTTGISCFGTSNGSARLLKDGQPVVLSSGTGFSCRQSTASPVSCSNIPTGSVVINNASNFPNELKDGKTYYLTVNYNGGVTFGSGGAKLIICSNSTFSYINFNSDNAPVEITITNLGKLNYAYLNLNSNVKLSNYGELRVEGAGFNGDFRNYKLFTCAQQFNVNSSSAKVYNSDSMRIGNDVNISQFNIFENTGTINAITNFTINGNGSFTNNCKLLVGGQMISNSVLKNYGLIKVTGQFTHNSNGRYTGEANSQLTAGSMMLNSNSEIKGIGNTCAGLQVLGQTQVNSNALINGNMGACFVQGFVPNSALGGIANTVTTNCSCNATGQMITNVSTATWSNGISGVNQLSNLSAGNYSVNTTLSGCQTQTLNFTITTPSALISSVSLNANKEAIVTYSGGTGAPSFVWNDGTTLSSPLRNLSQVPSGTYCVSVKDANNCSSSSACVTVTNVVTPPSCNLTVSTTPVSCKGSVNGNAQILKNGQPVTFSGGTCGTAPSNSFTCGNIPSSAVTVTQTNGELLMKDAKTYYLTNNFTGDAKFGSGGATLIVCGNATFNNINRNEEGAQVKIYVNGSLNVTSPNLNLGSNYTFTNYGSVSTNASGFDGAFYNYGTFTSSSNVNINNSSSLFANTGTITINGIGSLLINMPVFKNDGHIVVNKSLHINGSGKIENNCSIVVGEEFQFNGIVENRGLLESTNGESKLNGGSVYKGYSGSKLKVKSVFIGGQVQGLGTTCSAIQILNNANLSGNISGNIGLCYGSGTLTNSATIASTVTTNCSCTATGQASSGGITGAATWHLTNSTVGGSSVSNLSAGPYNVDVVIDGCPAENIQFTVASPELLTNNVTISSNNLATVNIIGGTSPYTVVWNDGITSTSANTIQIRDLSAFTSGTYCAKVRDFNQCESDFSCVNVNNSGAVDSTCVTKVVYNANSTVTVSIDNCDYNKIIGREGELVSSITFPVSKNDTLITVVNVKDKTEVLVKVKGLQTGGGTSDNLSLTVVSSEQNTTNKDFTVVINITSTHDGSFTVYYGTKKITFPTSGTYTLTDVDEDLTSIVVKHDLTDDTDSKDVDLVKKADNIYEIVSISGVCNVVCANCVEGETLQFYTNLVTPNNFIVVVPPSKILLSYPCPTAVIDPVITITDSRGDVQNLDVTSPTCTENIVYNLVSTVPSYKGKSDASVTISNLSANYTYKWKAISSFSWNFSSPINLSAGIYYFQFKNNTTGCIKKETVTIGEGVKMIIEQPSTVDPDNLDIEVTKGSTPVCNVVSITIKNPITGQEFTYTPTSTSCPKIRIPISAIPGSILSSPVVVVTVTDTEGNSSTSDAFVVDFPKQPCLSSTAYSFNSPKCVDANNGSIKVYVENGDKNFQWLDLTDDSKYQTKRTNLIAGTYNYSLENSNGCKIGSSIKLTNPKPIEVFPEIDDQDKSITLKVSGGNAPYTFKWIDENLETSNNTKTNLVSGQSYSVTIKDKNSCTYSHNFTFSPCGLVSIVPKIIVLSSGKVSATVDGDLKTYVYTWTKGSEVLTGQTQSLPTLTGNNTAVYVVKAVDLNGCEGSTDYTHQSPSHLCGDIGGLDVVPTDASFTNVCDGEAKISLASSANVADYVVLWDKKNLTDLIAQEGLDELQNTSSLLFTNACAGIHTVFISNKTENCGVEKEFTINGAPPIVETKNVVVTLSSSNVYDKKCYGEKLKDIVVKVNGGVAPYSYYWEHKESSSGVVLDSFTDLKPALSNAEVGIYTLVVTDSRKNTSNTITFTITGSKEPLVANHTIINPTCIGGTAGANISYSGGDGSAYTLLWSDGSTQFDRSDLLTDKTYTYTLTNGQCTFANNFKVKSISYNRTLEQTAELCPDTKIILSVEEINGYTIAWAKKTAGATYDPLENPTSKTQEINQAGVYQLKRVKASCSALIEEIEVLASECNFTIPRTCIKEEFSFPDFEESNIDQCAVNSEVYAMNVARVAYKNYIDGKKTEFQSRYRTQAMLNAKESLNIKFSDSEEHYTLYYYDQAGNLVQTVPPVGITTLGTADVKEIIDAQNESKKNNTVFATSNLAHTNHTLATTYSYNSLNQLVAQDVPDNDALKLWGESVNGQLVPSDQNISVFDAEGDNVWAFANDAQNAFMYTSINGGKSYKENFKLDLGEVKDIYSISSSQQVYAAGTKGLIMKSINGGKNWSLLTWMNNTDELLKIYVLGDVSNPVFFVLTKEGKMYRTTNPSSTWEEISINLQDGNTAIGTLNSFITSKTLTDIKFHSNQMYLTLNDGVDSWVFKGELSTSNSSFVLKAIKSNLDDNTISTINFVSANYEVITKDKNVYQLFNDKLHFNRKISGVPAGVDIKDYRNTGNSSVIYGSDNSLYTSIDGLNYVKSTLAVNTNYRLIETGSEIVVFDKYNATLAYKLDNQGVLNVLTEVGNTKNVKGYSKKGSTDYLLLFDNATSITTVQTITNSTTRQNIVLPPYYNMKSFVVAGNYMYLLNENKVHVINEITPTSITTLTGDYTDLRLINGEVFVLTADNMKKVTVSTGGIASVNATVVTSFTNYNYYDVDGKFDFSNDPTDYAYIGDIGTLYSPGSFVVRSKNSVLAKTNIVATPILLTTEPNANQGKTYSLGTKGAIYEHISNVEKMVVVIPEDNTKADIGKSTVQNTTLRYTIGSKVYEDASSALNNYFMFDVNSTIKSMSSNFSLTSDGKVYNNAIAESTEQIDQNIVYSNGAITLTGGKYGVIYYRENSTWIKSPIIRTAPIRAADLKGSDMLAVGDKGLILVSSNSGESFTPLNNAYTQTYTAVAVVSGTKFVVGNQEGKLTEYTKASGVYTASPVNTIANEAGVTVSSPINKIVYNNQGEIWALRGKDVLKKTSNNNFEFQFSAPQVLRDIYFVDDYGYIVGDLGSAYRIVSEGIVEQQDGLAVSAKVTKNNIDFLKIATDNNLGDDKGTGLPVGNIRKVQFEDRFIGYLSTENQLLKTIDGGYHWSVEKTQTGTLFAAVTQNDSLAFVDGSNFGTIKDQSNSITSRFWYDELGRLILSQNAKQFNIEKYLTEDQYKDVVVPQTGKISAYSYTLYDDIGRIKEVGELLTRKEVTTYRYESQILYSEHKKFIDPTQSPCAKVQISRTYYDRKAFPNLAISDKFEQTNLRPRVASVTYQQRDGVDYDRATHYSYDIHGNVKSLLQEIKRVEQNEKGYVGRVTKRIDYDYDLISGNVNRVYFQKGQEDAFTHKYEYDGDNRIQKVFTSTDNVIWNEEAKYDYYAHGPLARVTTGGGVDKCDFAYTIHGWIKGTVSDNFSYALGYYDAAGLKDYKAIGTNQNVSSTISNISNLTSNVSLYNGNISTMSTNTPTFSKSGMQTAFTKQFTYDQLNRIKTAQVIGSTNSFGTAYSYDANGNIKTLERRNGAGVVFDQLSYNYHNVDKGYLKNTNKLRSVNDLVSTQEGGKDLHGDDIEDQGIDNYSYDEIGNLIADESEDIERIEWTVSGKVFAVIRKASSTKANLYFSYDAMGNRISKKSVDPKLGNVHTTYYFREASGNTMATYEKAPNNSFTLSEQHIYGSSRLGMFTPVTSSNVHSTIKGDINKGNYLIGNRSYEFSDHLGNVHLVLNDNNVALSATEYYPFGMVMQSYSPTDYRYGFNGQEKETELNASITSAEYWFYDGRLGRRWNVDPVLKVYESPYACFGNTPIWASDPNGADSLKFTWGNKTYDTWKVESGEYLYKIASKTGVSVNKLFELNKEQFGWKTLEDANHIDIGDNIYLNDGVVELGGNNTNYTPAPRGALPGFPDARRVPQKAGRARWQNGKDILEWDSQHGELEGYDKNGKHKGVWDTDGNKIKDAVSGRKTATFSETTPVFQKSNSNDVVPKIQVPKNPQFKLDMEKIRVPVPMLNFPIFMPFYDFLLRDYTKINGDGAA